MRRLENSIAWRLTTWFLLLSLLPMGVLLVFVRRDVNTEFTNMAARNLEDRASLLATKVSLSPNAEGEVEVLLAASSDEDYTAFLIDQGGRYVAHSNADKVTESAYDDFSDAVIQQILTTDAGVVNEETVDFVIGYASVPNTSLEAVIAMDRAVVTSMMAQIESSAAVQLGISMLLVSIIAGVAIWILVSPLQQLTQAAEDLGAGELEVEVDPEEMEGELETLAIAFRKMAERIRSLVEGLEERVAERTRALERRANQLQATTEVARDAAALLDVEDLMSTVVRRISDRFGFYHAGIFMLDESGEYAVLRAASSPGGRKMIAEGHRLRVGKVGIVGAVAQSGEPRIALDVGEDAVFFENPDLPDTRSEMALPLSARGEVIGVLDVQSTEPEAFSDEDVEILRVMADQIGLAISNAQLYRQTQESLEAERRAYGQISQEAWVQMIRSRAELGYLSSEIQALQPVTGPWHAIMLEARERGEVVRDGEHIALPVKIRDRVLGVVRLCKPVESGSWTSEEIALIETLTEQLSTTLESARLYEETQQRAIRERLTSEVLTRMRRSLDLDTVMSTAAREIRTALDLPELTVQLVPNIGHSGEKTVDTVESEETT